MGIRRSPTCFFLSCKNILVHCEKTEKRRKMDGQCFALLIDADNVSAKYIKPILIRTIKIWKYHIQENLWRLDQHPAFQLEG